MPTDGHIELGLIACIALAQEEFGSLPKDAHATIRSDKGTYEYDYISESAIYDRVREILSPLGVATLVSCTDVESKSGGVWVTVSVTFAKGDEREVIYGRAEGLDPRDKSYNKAITTAVRIALTKTFLQGGDIDPEQTVNERTRPLAAGPVKLSESRLKAVTKKAIDSKITTPDGALDGALLLRIASFKSGQQIKRLDEIPGPIADALVEQTLDGYAANPARGLKQMEAKEVELGW